jgi:uncharacterized protein
MIKPYIKFAIIKGKGRGMVTTKQIKEGTIIEVSPVIVMTKAEQLLIDKTKLHDYIFLWQEDESQCAMAQGYISVYNHSYNSNCDYMMDFEQDTISIITVKDIDSGEELTINYNGEVNDPTPVWFETKPNS